MDYKTCDLPFLLPKMFCLLLTWSDPPNAPLILILVTYDGEKIILLF